MFHKPTLSALSAVALTLGLTLAAEAMTIQEFRHEAYHDCIHAPLVVITDLEHLPLMVIRGADRMLDASLAESAGIQEDGLFSSLDGQSFFLHAKKRLKAMRAARAKRLQAKLKAQGLPCEVK